VCFPADDALGELMKSLEVEDLGIKDPLVLKTDTQERENLDSFF
jgi:hypothetical protein